MDPFNDEETNLKHIARITLGVVAAAASLMTATVAHSQQNIEKLKQMKVATTDLNIPLVPQTGKNADAIKET